jgi:choline dehydrogenase
MLYLRGQAEDFNSWAADCDDPSWRWEHMVPLFKGQENYHGGETDMHGSKGPWRVEKIRSDWEILDAFADAAVKYGLPRVADFNKGDNFGVGYFDVNQNDGFRQNTYHAFLPHKRANLHVMSETLVEKLLLDDAGGECYGVRVQGKKKGNVDDILASKEVILTAGAVGSVQVLERSGVGRGDVLDKAGVRPVVEMPGVGENLQDHLQLRLVFEVDNVPTLNTRASSLWGKARIGLEYLLHRTGPMASAPSQLGAFLLSSPEVDRPNLQYHIQPLSLLAFGQDLDPFNAFTASICDLRPTSRGTVHIDSTGKAIYWHVLSMGCL